MSSALGMKQTVKKGLNGENYYAYELHGRTLSGTNTNVFARNGDISEQVVGILDGTGLAQKHSMIR